MTYQQKKWGITGVVVGVVLIAALALLVVRPHTKQESKLNYSGTTVTIPLFSQNDSTATVSFVAPDGWTVDKDSGKEDFFADDLTYKPGTAYQHANVASDRDIDRFMLSVTDANDVPKEYKAYQKSEHGLVNGNKTTLYYYKFSKGEHIGNVQMQGGETEHMYFITKGSDAVMVSYYLFVGDKDQQSLIDQVIQSIKF